MYSVDPSLIDKRVGIEMHDENIYIYFNDQIVSVHKAFDKFTKKQMHYREEDYRKLMAAHYKENDIEKMEAKIKENLEMMDRLIGERNVQSTDKQFDRVETV
jgi:GTP-binding protein EngB required for normal cell division